MASEDLSEPAIIPLPAFAASEEDAIERFERTCHADPFPDIAPALLNTADLVEYIAATGMLHPFTVHPGNASELLKPASCGMRLAGPVVFWDDAESENPVKVTHDLVPGEEFQLKRNSIVYVTLEPVLRMPDYIAARFNLTIRDIYRGVLAGTGPLVDPGFVGQISVPLHNLTCNDYMIKAGEPIAWMEFTKLSPNQRWTAFGASDRVGAYVPFPERKRGRRTVDDYLSYASAVPITSSIPPLVGRAERSATATRAAAETQLRTISRFSILALLAVVLTLGAILVSVYSLVDSSNSSRTDLTRQVLNLEHELAALHAHKPNK